MRKELNGSVMLVVCAFIWGTGFVAQSVGAKYTGPAVFLAARSLLAGASLLPVILAFSLFGKKTDQGVSGGEGTEKFPLKSGVICGVVLFLSSYLQQVGIIYTTAGKAGFITALYLVIVPVMGLFLGGKLRPRVWACVAGALFGMYLLCVKKSEPLNTGDMYILACAFLCALHVLMVGHYAPRADCIRLSAIQIFVCGFISLAAALLTENIDLSSIRAAWIPIAYAGIMSTSVAFTLQVMAQKYVSPVRASLMMSLESVFAALTGWLILGEALLVKELAGCAVIFVSAITAQIQGKKSE